jgi:predicted nucleic acid-binding protein
MLPREAIEEFREIYKIVFRKEIDETTASEKAEQLLNLIKIIYFSQKQFQAEKKRENTESIKEIKKVSHY